MSATTSPTGTPGPRLGGTYPEPWLLPRRVRWVYRFVLGRPMDNTVRTDATFWHPARTGYPSRWLRLAGWQRAAVRLAGSYLLAVGVLMVLAALVGWTCERLGTEVPDWVRVLSWGRVLSGHVLTVLAVGVPVGTYVRVRDYGMKVPVPDLDLRWTRTVGSWQLPDWVPDGVRVPARGPDACWTRLEVPGRKVWEVEKVRPVAAAVAQVLQLPARPEKARDWVAVPRTYQDPAGSPVEVLLPSNFTGSDKGVQDRLVKAVGSRLGMRDPLASWQLAGSAPRVLISVPPAPPEKVTFDMVRDLLLLAEEYRPLLGLNGTGAGTYAEMIEASPHIALTAGPGAGKSTLAKLVMMQCLRWGWGVVILDWKQTEAYKWAIGLPGVTYLTDIAGIHDFGVRIGEEIDIRKVAGLTGRAKVLVVRDEWNVTADLLMAYWQDLRATAEPEEKRTMPLKSPALRGFAALDYAGREFGLHDFVITQRLSARVFNGNADIRECFGIKGAARYSPATAKLLFGNIKLPRKNDTPGRWVIVAGEDVAVIQVPLITNEEAREFALGGVENPITPLSSSYYPGLSVPDDTDSTLGDSLRSVTAGPLAVTAAPAAQELARVDARKLSDMVDSLANLGITLPILRKAAREDAQGDPTFPKPHGGTPNRGYTYDIDAVREWARTRHAMRHAEKVTK